MAESFVAVRLPTSFYNLLQGMASATERSVEEMLTTSLTEVLPIHERVPKEIAVKLEAMRFFTDNALFAALKPAMDETTQARFQALNALAKELLLTQSEIEEQDRLRDLYQFSVIQRAQAMAILTQRGYAVLPEPDLAV